MSQTTMPVLPRRGFSIAPTQPTSDSDLDLPAASPAPQIEPDASPEQEPSPADIVMSKALYGVWSGDLATLVSSPPGSGKTRLVSHLASQLADRAGFTVAVAAQTTEQALDVANRCAELSDNVTLLTKSSGKRPGRLAPDAKHANSAARLAHQPGIIVATTARWQWIQVAAFSADVLIVDECWQLTYADLGALGPLAPQLVMVGDPGQIDPVVTGSTRRWAHSPTGPHIPAPDALLVAHGEHVTRLRLPQTYRLGPATTALIQPAFYPALPFTSARQERHITVRGADLPEIAHMTVTGHSGPADPNFVRAAANRVRDLVATGTVTAENQDGTRTTRPLQPKDIAVVCPHVAQAAAVNALLTDMPDVLIGTANSLQGLEREAVVALHPLVGYRDATAFSCNPGRMCVALSRHRAHLSIIVDTSTTAVLGADPSATDSTATDRRDRPAESADLTAMRNLHHRLLTEHPAL